MWRNLNVTLCGCQATVPRYLLNHTGMYATLSQLGEHSAPPAVTASTVHAHLLIKLAKHLLDCLTAESPAFLAR